MESVNEKDHYSYEEILIDINEYTINKLKTYIIKNLKDIERWKKDIERWKKINEFWERWSKTKIEEECIMDNDDFQEEYYILFEKNIHD